VIAIIDYGMGNLRSAQKAFERMGFAAEITNDPAILARADRVVLPGVGGFGDAMRELRERNLVEPIRATIASGKPFLGICLGLQLLFDVGYEDGEHEGLGVLPGKVVRFDLPRPYKVPHIGWNDLTFLKSAPIFAGLKSGVQTYFVHSYYVVPGDPGVVAATANYPEPFAAAIWRNNVFAVQFHPEKSQADGLKMIQNFSRLDPVTLELPAAA
jgi:glutamine amidotransferase